MSERPWYEELFGEIYLRAWAPYITPQRTLREVDGIVVLLNLASGARILDLACGTGRIAIPLAQRGFEVTGLDLSTELLARAKDEAANAGAEVRWIHSDMRAITFQNEFDAVINIFTSFGYLESETEDAKVLRAVHDALKPGGAFLLEFANRDYRMRHFQAAGIDRLGDGAIALHEAEFDLRSSRHKVRVTVIERDGRRLESGFSVRMYTLTELVRMIEGSGLTVESCYGGLDGSDLTLDSRRVVILSRKAPAS